MAAFQLPYLANQAAHCTGSSGDDKGVARVGFADLEKAKVFKDNLVGDVLICSGILAYLGVFVQSYRQECVETWGTMMKKYNI